MVLLTGQCRLSTKVTNAVDPPLTKSVHITYSKGRGESTRQNYSTGVKAFADFLSKNPYFHNMFACYLCAKHKPEIQAVETALMYYVVWLRENRGRLNKTGIKASSIRNYVVHVANFFDDVGSTLPDRSKFSRYNRTLAGLENLEDTLALPEFRVFRVTLQFLRKGCFKLLDLSDPDTVMFWTLITSAVTNAFRLKGIGLVRSKPDAVRNPIEVVRVQHLTFKPNMLRPLSSTLFKKRTKTSKNVDISWGYSKNNVINPVKYQR